MSNFTETMREINEFAEIHLVTISFNTEWLGHVLIEMRRDEFKITRRSRVDIFADGVDVVRNILDNMAKELDKYYGGEITLPLRRGEIGGA